MHGVCRSFSLIIVNLDVAVRVTGKRWFQFHFLTPLFARVYIPTIRNRIVGMIFDCLQLHPTTETSVTYKAKSVSYRNEQFKICWSERYKWENQQP